MAQRSRREYLQLLDAAKVAAETGTALSVENKEERKR